jgi:RNA polymerase sigma-70 factor (ECF subfamily)
VADPDENLIRRCLAGDSASVRSIVEQYERLVFGLCYRMLGHRQDAEDTTQETFIRVVRSLHRWDRSRPFRPWLLAIAANRCRTLLSTRKKAPVSVDTIDHQAVAPDSTNSGSDLAEELQRALDSVREEYRLVFTLYHLQELPLSEISVIVQHPEGTIKTWLFRVRRELAEFLRRRGFQSENEHAMQSL